MVDKKEVGNEKDHHNHGNVIFSFCLSLGQGTAQAKRRAEGVHELAVTNIMSTGFKRFIQLVNERAKGELEIKLMAVRADFGEGISGRLQGHDGYETLEQCPFCHVPARRHNSSLNAVKLWLDPNLSG